MKNKEKSTDRMVKNWKLVEQNAIKQAKKEPVSFAEFDKLDAMIGKQIDAMDERSADRLGAGLDALIAKKKK